MGKEAVRKDQEDITRRRKHGIRVRLNDHKSWKLAVLMTFVKYTGVVSTHEHTVFFGWLLHL